MVGLSNFMKLLSCNTQSLDIRSKGWESMWEGADYLQIRGSGSLLSDPIERKITLRNDKRGRSL